MLWNPKGEENEIKFVIDWSSVSANNKKTLQSLQNLNFINSAKHGILLKNGQWLFKKDWEEKYCVLTNIGLLYFDDV